MAVSKTDVKILNDYKFENADDYRFGMGGYNRARNKQLLGVKSEKGQESLTTVETKDLTIWNFFLSLFGAGKLAHIDLDIRSISTYLAKFDWDKDVGSAEHYEVMSKVRQIAGRNLIRNNDSALWKKYSLEEDTKFGKLFLNDECNARILQHMLASKGAYRFYRLDGLKVNNEWVTTNYSMHSVETIKKVSLDPVQRVKYVAAIPQAGTYF